MGTSQTWTLRLVLMERVKAATTKLSTVLLFSSNPSPLFLGIELQPGRSEIQILS